MYKVVFLRHGESQWNLENRFTGWKDVDLSSNGHQEAIKSGQVLKAEGYEFDLVYTSVLKRAIRTLWHVLSEMDLMWLPVIKSWRLNERHYGALQGLNKIETVEKYGEQQVKIWRRSYSTPPPLLKFDDERHPRFDHKYKEIEKNDLPLGESLKDTKARVMPIWNNEITNSIRSGRKVLIVAHGNSIRSLVQHLDNLSEEQITELNIPTGIPLVYELDHQFKPTKSYYLGDAASLEAAKEKVANQTKK